MISCKVELKLRWTKYCLLSVSGTESDVHDKLKIIMVIILFLYYQRHKLYVPVVTLSARDN